MQTCRQQPPPGITRRLVLAAPVAIAAFSLGGPALAQARYPTKPITLLVGFPPGGSTDFIGRLVAQKLTEVLGQPVVVDNKGGANGLLAANAVAAAAPDGYTLLLTSMGMTTNPYLYRKTPRDPVRDFTSIAMLASVPNVIVVNPSLPARDLKELLALARSRSSGTTPLTLATTGNAAPGHLASELLQRAAKVRFEFVPYKGSGPAITDIIAGHVDMSLPTVLAAAPHIRSGKLRAIAVTGSKPSAMLPDVPTISQAGLKELSTGSGWYALIGPAGMPKDVVERLSSECQKIMANAEVHERFVANGADPMFMNHDEMSSFVARDFKNWGELIKSANIKAEE
ncbi:tripartite tricarboxylate transporter substrate binding protein [Variovorax guangxiensis]|uniref:Bug family tripartite tricarboxylate transporter substrate binding protein n=1 Tax=Variovorax guangxiensis TaxID=1775474 RepID=UPI0028639B04|nr:tripartite tricarboxylate transporter substrate binding protein [Variovorax guangxiensis]MDR6860911.1 tripartite-type tricarboxylate transporter receptor subunit TctC [Variovorax guangxiensis]